MRQTSAVALCLLVLLVALPSAAGPAAEEDAAAPLAADPRVADAIDAWTAWLDYQLDLHGVPGASLALVHDQEVLLARGLGQADPEAGRAADADTLYSICSISKLFTSVAAMRLHDAGLLRLDEPVATYLDWYDIRDDHPADEAVTLRRILTHSAGLPRESDAAYWNAPDFPFPTRDEIIEQLSAQHTLYPSGRYFQYSNLGLTLAGEVVAAVAERPWGDYVEAEVLTPLGMTSTRTEIPADDPRLARGHGGLTRELTRPPLPPFQSRGIAPAAGMASSAADLARFAAWQFRLLEDGAEAEVVEPATLRRMHRVHWVDPDWETTWGLGFHVENADGRTLVGHGGACPGYFSNLVLDPKAELAAVVLTNAMGVETGRYTRAGLKLLRPAVEAATAEDAEAPDRDPALHRYTGVYTSLWGEAAVVRWEEGLAVLWLDSGDPKETMSRLRREEGVPEHVFRRVRDDDDTLGEEVVFEVGDDGRATRFRQHSFWMTRAKDLP